MIQRAFNSFRQVVFTPPHLPGKLVLYALLLAISHTAILLMNQPAAYWLDSRHTSIAFGQAFQVLLSQGVWIYGGVVTIYLVAAALLLRYLKISLALPLFGALSLFHFYGIIWSHKCESYPFIWFANSALCANFWTVWWYFWVLLLGLLLVDIFILKESLFSHFKGWAAWLLYGIAVAWLLFLGLGIVLAAKPLYLSALPTWQPVISAHSPGARSKAVVAYDTKRGRAVLFGGITQKASGEWTYETDTWEWDGKDWTQVQVSGGPQGRLGHAMAYDQKRGVVVLFGGWNNGIALNDLWEWDGKTWNRACVCNPSARYSHQMYYDPIQSVVFVYGGTNGPVGYHEAWGWTGQAWGNVVFDSQAPDAWSYSLVYDQTQQRVIAFLNQAWGGTWILKDYQWSKLDGTIQPPMRSNFNLVYDPDHDRTVLFGGSPDDATWLNDTWIFKDDSWQKIETSMTPPPRSEYAAFYDPSRHKVIIYGGDKSGNNYNDMWELALP